MSRSSSSSPAPTPKSGSSDLSSPPRVSSPLNPNSTPTALSRSSKVLLDVQEHPVSPGGADDHSTPPAPRGRTLSSSSAKVVRRPSPHATFSLQVSASDGQTPSSLSLPEFHYDGESLSSSMRARSKSPNRGGRGRDDATSLSPKTHQRGLSSSWWGGHQEESEDPWKPEKLKRRRPTLEEHKEVVESTRKKVAQATASVLGTAVDVLHEGLYLSVELLDLAPIPGLGPAARTLLSIWDACEAVDMNFLACLRLTERCADILLSVRREVFEAGDVVGQELMMPIQKLEESFLQVNRLLLKQSHRPFLKRYLKREEILRDLQDCDTVLRDALALFSISIQVRILKQIQATERRRNEEAQEIIKALYKGERPPIPQADPEIFDRSETDEPLSPTNLRVKFGNISSETITHFTTTSNALGLSTDTSDSQSLSFDSDASSIPPSDILPTITALHSAQNSLDTTRDLADLRKLMRDALQAGSDAKMVEVLQIGRQEMPDAIKTLQRALERLSERESDTGNILGMHGVDSPPPTGVIVGRIVRRAGTRDFRTTGSPSGSTDEGADLRRSKTVISVESSDSSSGSASGTSSEQRRKETLDREFIETGIDALRRLSGTPAGSLPSWTITKYEVDRDEKIGIGFFSDVFKGKWRGKTVAIKVLAETTPRNLFVREVGIWKTLNHNNVLQLYGASSASGDPPWFFVSPYMKHGSLNQYLSRLEKEERLLGFGVGIGAHVPPKSVPSIRVGKAGSFPNWQPVGAGSFTSGSPPKHTNVHAPGYISSPTPSISSSNGGTGGGTGNGSNVLSPTFEYGEVHKEWDLLRFMHEIAKGMAYLHGRGVLHGDLKAANVLVNDRYRCVITDFGLSEMKSEAFRISGTIAPQGTLRWQSPELMAGTQTQLTSQIDVWAFSICCVEILTLGRIPWPLHDDDDVRRFVLHEHSRPQLPPNSRFNTPGLQKILWECWHTDPAERPQFSKISRELRLLRKAVEGKEYVDSPHVLPIEEIDEPMPSPSPDMRPIELPDFLRQTPYAIPPKDVLVGGKDPLNKHSALKQASESVPPAGTHPPQTGPTIPGSYPIKMPEPIPYSAYTPRSQSSQGSLVIPLGASSSMYMDEQVHIMDYDGYESPPPTDERVANIKNEMRYRMLLTHDLHPSLTLPLWHPTPIDIASVGFLLKPEGEFISLFNALVPLKADHPAIQQLPSIHGYGKAETDSARRDNRTLPQRGIDAVTGWLPSFGNSKTQNVVRRYPFPLKAGHKAAYLCTESSEYRYFKALDAPKKWFKAHIDTILRAYGAQYQLQREDIFLVIGTLRTHNYGLFVSHRHPEGHVHFNVFGSPKAGQPWGEFKTDRDVNPELGPQYEDDGAEPPAISASKVSRVGGPLDTVLLARLRFKPDAQEPTSK